VRYALRRLLSGTVSEDSKNSEIRAEKITDLALPEYSLSTLISLSGFGNEDFGAHFGALLSESISDVSRNSENRLTESRSSINPRFR
jgi:hypothetical protein